MRTHRILLPVIGFAVNDDGRTLRLVRKRSSWAAYAMGFPFFLLAAIPLVAYFDIRNAMVVSIFAATAACMRLFFASVDRLARAAFIEVHQEFRARGAEHRGTPQMSVDGMVIPTTEVRRTLVVHYCRRSYGEDDTREGWVPCFLLKYKLLRLPEVRTREGAHELLRTISDRLALNLSVVDLEDDRLRGFSRWESWALTTALAELVTLCAASIVFFPYECSPKAGVVIGIGYATGGACFTLLMEQIPYCLSRRKFIASHLEFFEQGTDSKPC